MLEWSEKFATKIGVVDKQHRQIFELINELSQCCQENTADAKTVANALISLNEYSHKHFIAEEAFMVKMKLDQRHIKAHRMEHRSFMYDVESLSVYADTPESLIEATEKLVVFTTNWWCYHILGIDRTMAKQLFALKRGKSSAEAYEASHNIKYDNSVMHLMLDSTLQLWRSTTERCHLLEKKLASIGKNNNS